MQVVEQLHLLLLQEGDVPLHALDLALQGHGLHRNRARGPRLRGEDTACRQTAAAPRHPGSGAGPRAPAGGRAAGHRGHLLPAVPPRDVAAGKVVLCRGCGPAGGPAGAAPESPHGPIPGASSRCGLESSDAAQTESAAVRPRVLKQLASILNLALGNVSSLSRITSGTGLLPAPPAVPRWEPHQR